MASNGFIKKLWNWFDNWFLLFATAFFIVFIPLYPKIPFADIIPGYIVRLRLEDVFIAIAAAWWGVQVLRRKVHWKTPLTAAIALYVICGLISNVAGVYWTKTIPNEMLHFGKSMLHWARYIQYFSLYFIAFTAIKNRRHAFAAVILSLVTVLLVGLYGYGQKEWYWPVYSTMNREFSKGVRLYLGEHARVQSTFAGHYDLGAYLVILTPFALAVFFLLGNKKTRPDWIKPRVATALRVLSVSAWFTGLWLLVMSASRASFIGYVLSLGLVILIWAWRYQGVRWFLTRGFIFFAVSGIMLVFVGDLSTRFAQLIDQNKHPQLYEAYHTLNGYTKQPAKLLGLATGRREPPAGAKSVEELEAELNASGMTSSDTLPTSDRPSDVQVDVPERVYDLNDPEATLAGRLVQQGDKLIEQRTFSECALNRSLSLCIRLEVLWPQAIQGFQRNVLFGSGYATLTKSTVGQFTEAESTDNNFLRTLGENGALGFFFFYGAMGLSLWWSWLAVRRSQDPLIVSLAMASFAGVLGLFVNAMYIDVFASSKVAYTFWLMQGVVLALLVKEGVVAPQFAFERQQVKQETAQLSQLLQSVDTKREEKYADSQYLSAKKQSAKRRKGKKARRA